MKAIAGDKRSEADADLSVPQAQLPSQRRNLTHHVLSERYLVRGRVETDTPTMAAHDSNVPRSKEIIGGAAGRARRYRRHLP